MANIQLRRLQVVLAKIEATEGVDPTPTGADALQLLEPAVLSFGAEVPNAQDDRHNNLLEADAPLAPSYPFGEISGRIYQRGKGSAYSTSAGPEPHALLQAFGLSALFTTDHWDYDTISVLASTGLKTVTLYGYQGIDTNVWVLHKLLAARVSRLAFTYSAGAPATLDWAVRGEYVAPTDAALITPAYFATIPPRFAKVGSWGLGAYTTGLVSRAAVTLENTLAWVDNANLTSTRYVVSSRRLGWNVEIASGRIADYDPFTKWTSRAQEALAIDVGVAGGQNRIQIAADRAQISEPPRYEERNGLVRWAAQGVLDPGGTNRCKITFGA